MALVTLPEARALLNIVDNASPATVQKAYRAAAMQAHQALGVAGAGVALRTLAEARTLAVAAARLVPCPTCGGHGWRVLQRGFTATQIPCLSCGGTGRMHYEV